MQDNNPHLDRRTTTSPQPEIDYTPKEYNSSESIRIMIKFLSVAGIIFLLLWIYELH